MAGLTLQRLLGQVIAVRDMNDGIANLARLGMPLADHSDRKDWGIDTATVAFPGGSYIEVVSSLDPTTTVGGTVHGFLDRKGEGLYLTAIEVDDVHATYDHLVGAGVPVVGPPVPAPAERGIDCELLWLKPSATCGAFLQLLSYRGERHQEEVLAPGCRRLLTQAIAVRDLDAGVASLERIGMELWDRSRRAQWGLDTAVFRLAEGSSVELVAPIDSSRPAAAAMTEWLDRRGPGHYMTVIEVDDVDAVHERLVANDVPTLGPPSDAPPESPWDDSRQLWVHPKATNSAFIEFLSFT